MSAEPKKDAHWPAAAALSTQELLDELERRSLGMLCVCVRIEEDHGAWGDTWHYRVKGSNVMLGAMSAAVTIKMQRVLEDRGQQGQDALGAPAA